MDELAQIMSEKGASVLLLQEPSVKAGHVYGLGPATRCFCVTEHPRSAVILLDSGLDALLLAELSGEDLVAVKIRNAWMECVVLSVYMSPNENHESVLRRLDFAVGQIGDTRVLVGGDFNAWACLWGSGRDSARGSEVALWAASRGLSLLNRVECGPTFIGGRGSSYIDLTWASADWWTNAFKWCMDFETSSDHGLITVQIVRDPDTPEESTSTCRFNTRKGNWKVYRAEVNNLLVDYTLEHSVVEGGLSATVGELERVLGQAAFSAIPVRKNARRRSAPWWTPELAALRQDMIQGLRKKQHCMDLPHRQHFKQQYSIARKLFKTEVRRSKRQSWRTLVTERLSQDPWSLPYRVLSKKIGPDGTVGSIRVNGVPAQTWEDAGRAYLSEVFPKDAPENDSAEDRRRRNQVERPLDTPDSPPWTRTEFKAATGSFGRYKAPGLDGIDMAMIKESTEEFQDALLLVYNRALELGEFPAQWKAASIKALLKSPDRDPGLSSSYRPISLLAVDGKLLERLMLNKLEPYLVPALHPNQYGCVKGRTTEDAITTLMTMVKGRREKQVMVIFYDIEGAFNAVWWPLVLSRLRDLMIPSNLYSLMVSYFSKRRADLLFRHGKVSTEVSRGCPQGSVLGAVIWNLVFSQLLCDLGVEDFSGVAYVDDLAVVVSADTAEGLSANATRCSGIVEDWCRRARLGVAAAKTQALVMKGKKNVRDSLTFAVGGELIQAGLTAKYLGVIIHRNKSLEPHVNLLQTKICRAVGLMRGVRGSSWGLQFSEAARYYKGVFLPTILYAAATWWAKPSKKIRDKVQSLQRAALIPLTKAYRTSATAALQVIAGIEPLDLVLDGRVAVSQLNWPQRTLAEVRPQLQAKMNAADNKVAKLGEVRSWVREEWQSRWDGGTTGRLAYAFFPSIRTRIESNWLQPGYAETQLMTGHGNFNARLHFFKRRDSRACSCGEPEETAEHVLRSCRMYNRIRRDCFGSEQYNEGLHHLVESREAYERFK
ncbi:unnamed protein product, partial [Nesidiocoris tenuis]